MAADELSRVSFSFFKGRGLSNQCLLASAAFIHKIGFASHPVDGGVRREVQVLRWTQVNQFTEQKIDQSAITSRRLGG